MAAASTLRRAAAAAAAIHQRPAAVALLRPVSGASIHPTTSLHRRFLHAVASRRAPFLGQRRLFADAADAVVVDKATAEKIMEEIGRIDAAAGQRHAATNKKMLDLASKVGDYTKALSTKSVDKTIDVSRTALKVCSLVLVASVFLGGTSFYVLYSAGGAAVSDEARKLLEQKTKEIDRRLEDKLVEILAEQQQKTKEAMEANINTREAALQEREERLLARQKDLNKKLEVGDKKKKLEVGDKKKKLEVVDSNKQEEIGTTKRDGKNAP